LNYPAGKRKVLCALHRDWVKDSKTRQ